MVRLRLAEVSPSFMAFDLPGRLLVLGHRGDAKVVLDRLIPLGYGAELQASQPMSEGDWVPDTDESAESHVLWRLLALNAMMFVVEMVAGWWAQSAGLLSDGADMLADAAVYGIALYAVGRSAAHKMRAARVSGWLQLALALAVLTETTRRVLTGSFPEQLTMVGVSLMALAVNVACLWMISKHRHGGVHMRASYIFSATDVLANLGVILAGMLVAWTGRAWPDWLIGWGIGLLVLMGAVRILKLK